MTAKSAALSAENVTSYDAILIATDHDAVDWAVIGHSARLIVDTRNVMARNGIAGGHIVKS